MLTKEDLKKFKEIIREEIETESDSLGNKINTELKFFRMQIQGDLKNLSDRVKNQEIKLKTIDRKLDKAINFLDKENINVLLRVQKLEETTKN